MPFEVSLVASHRRGFDGGRGGWGIWIPPHEVVEHDPKLLAPGVAPCISRAVELLVKPLPWTYVRQVPPESRGVARWGQIRSDAWGERCPAGVRRRVAR
jgi:hypothetical protein